MSSEEVHSEQLQDILKAIDNGENILLHGPGGTGKTYTLRKIAVHVSRQNRKIACTATTGVAAIGLNNSEHSLSATTLHSWAGVKLARDVSKKLHALVENDSRAKKRWLSTDVLILDEVSMLGADLIDKLDYIGRHIRQCEDPFGGIQLIFSGDFMQLPPVKDKWCFKSYAWKEFHLRSFIFEESKRYDDENYFQLLLRIRSGKHTEKDLKVLRARRRAYQKFMKVLAETDSLDVIRPTVLFSKKSDVERYNERELAKLPGQTYEFIAEDKFKSFNNNARYDHYIRLLDDAIPKAIPIKIGAQVMLKRNLDVAGGLVNGSRGVVSDVSSDSITVRFLNGAVLATNNESWVIEDKDGKASRAQIPFILAWALTIHKCQGSTLDLAVCDLGPSVFAPGQAYVALSRIRNLKSLLISDFYGPSIQTCRTALKYSTKIANQKTKERKRRC